MTDSLVRATYRRLLKQVTRVDSFYKGDADLSFRAMFGLRFSASSLRAAGFGAASEGSAARTRAAAAALGDVRCAGLDLGADPVSGVTLVEHGSGDGARDATRCGAASLVRCFYRARVKSFARPPDAAIAMKELEKAFWVMRCAEAAVPPEGGEQHMAVVRPRLVTGDATTSALELLFHNDANMAATVLPMFPREHGGEDSEEDSDDAGRKGGAPPNEMALAFPPSRFFAVPNVYWVTTLESVRPFPMWRESLALAITEATQGSGPPNSSGKKARSTSNELLALCAAGDAAGLDAAFATLPAETTTATDGIIEVMCKPRYLGVRAADESDMRETDEEDGSDDSSLRHSSPVAGAAGDTNLRHVWEYTIAIRNIAPRLRRADAASPDGVKGTACDLLVVSRHWQFTDLTDGSTHEVVGPGVVGCLPRLAPGESHVYVSATTVIGSRGVMQGEFQVLYRPIFASRKQGRGSKSEPEDADETEKATLLGGGPPVFVRARVAPTRLAIDDVAVKDGASPSSKKGGPTKKKAAARSASPF